MASPSNPESPLETFWRATIMLGTIVVSAMALYVYGPPPEKAVAMLGGALQRIDEMINSPEASRVLPAVAPTAVATTEASSELASPFLASATTPQPPAPLPASSLNVAGAGLTPASSVAMIPVPASPALGELALSIPQRDALAAMLASHGAQHVELSDWGSDGQWHRCCFTAPLPGGSGFQRHFEAVAASPREAVTAALAQLQDWRNAARAPINR